MKINAQRLPKGGKHYGTIIAVTTPEINGSASPRLPQPCEGISARWCPNHGDCTCGGYGTDQWDPHADMDEGSCPLHASSSDHPWSGTKVNRIAELLADIPAEHQDSASAIEAVLKAAFQLIGEPDE